MANQTYKVVKGDTLTAIAATYGTTVGALVALNNIKDPDYIVVGQVLIIKGVATAIATNTTSRATIRVFGLQSNTDRTMYATWTWDKSNTENYRVIWYYDTGDGVWFQGNDSTVGIKQSIYTAPSNAKRVKFKVKPISKTRKVNNKELSYWTADWSTVKTYSFSSNPPTTPPVPTVTITGYTLKASLDNLDVNANMIEFQVVRNDLHVYNRGVCKSIILDSATYSCTIAAGDLYKVRCRAIRGELYSDWSDYSGNAGTIPASPKISKCQANSETSAYLEWPAVINATSYDLEYTTKKSYFDGSDQTTVVSGIEFTHYEKTGLTSGEEYFFRIRAVNDKGHSGWSEISSTVLGKCPSAPTTWSSTTIAISGKDVNLYWVHNSEDGSSQTYAEIELYIDGVKETYTIQNSTGDDKDKTSTYTLQTTEYDEGAQIEWRVRTAGVTKVYGDWSAQRTIDIYAPPTLELNITDSSSPEATVEPDIVMNVGDTLELYLEDWEGAEMYENGYQWNEDDSVATVEIYTGMTWVEALSPGVTRVCSVDPFGNLTGGVGYFLTIQVDDASVKADIVMNLGDTLDLTSADWEGVEFFDTGNLYNEDDSVASISIDASSAHITAESVGVTRVCSAIQAGDACFLTIKVIIPVMQELKVLEALPFYISGLTAPNTQRPIGYHLSIISNDVYETVDSVGNVRMVNKGEAVYSKYFDTSDPLLVELSANSLDLENNVTYTVQCIVSMDSGLTAESSLEFTVAWTDEQYEPNAEIGINEDIFSAYIRPHCEDENGTPIEDVLLSVYRREFDGSFTELAKDIDNTSNTFVTDPHPALDYARYRVVAKSMSTGSVSYYDVPAYPVGCKAVIIQWDENWSSFDTSNEDAMEQPSWSGSMIKLPYNIDVSDSHRSDVALVEYIGRKRPVSYYGTQLGETSVWNVAIDKADVDTLYALRRLAVWTGNVYVREPSGSGYWANITVSFSQKHRETTIPVTIDIVRVEGGI